MTNEQLAEFIKAGDSDELIPILWERVRKLLYVISGKWYRSHSEMCASNGITEWDLKQEAYSAYLGAVKAYDRAKGYMFTSYLDLQFKKVIRHLFSKDPLNASQSLNAAVSADDESSAEHIDFIPDETAYNNIERIDETGVTAIVREAVERLPVELQAVISCRYYEELTREKTALRLSIAENEVLNREHRAINMLRNDVALRKLALEYRRLGLL